ncbi:hypothetical protein Acr_28g0001710 [Actinidia rufa]|uniref:Uncharacterized protein n=1 Tax=Actinidia rufa TaxID=165716 RepID=A0A7J0H8R2_9ERIC|nr:hypothetical protein Acr_28g0001710 [Actinidia rufa]
MASFHSMSVLSQAGEIPAALLLTLTTPPPSAATPASPPPVDSPSDLPAPPPPENNRLGSLKLAGSRFSKNRTVSPVHLKNSGSLKLVVPFFQKTGRFSRFKEVHIHFRSGEAERNGSLILRDR